MKIFTRIVEVITAITVLILDTICALGIIKVYPDWGVALLPLLILLVVTLPFIAVWFAVKKNLLARSLSMIAIFILALTPLVLLYLLISGAVI